MEPLKVDDLREQDGRPGGITDDELALVACNSWCHVYEVAHVLARHGIVRPESDYPMIRGCCHWATGFIAAHLGTRPRRLDDDGKRWLKWTAATLAAYNFVGLHYDFKMYRDAGPPVTKMPPDLVLHALEAMKRLREIQNGDSTLGGDSTALEPE